MTEQSEQNFASSIRQTGFCLEHRTTNLLRKRGWRVINNRYYVDDQSGAVREIDLVAYRVRRVDHLIVFTVLLISCKKSEKNAWILLSRPVHGEDPNTDRQPVHIWTNDDVVTWMLQNTEWKDIYFNLLIDEGIPKSILDSDHDVFAFQEIDKTNYKVQNDKAIFSSVTSLIKAQAYELGLLPGRKKYPSIYQFNLLSLLDGDLVRLEFNNEDDGVKESNIAEELYFFDYIVHKRRTTARIHFICESSFNNALSAYENIDVLNGNFMRNLMDSFYRDVIANSSKREVLQPIFEKKVRSTILPHLLRKGVVSKEYIKTEIGSVSDGEVCVHVMLKDGPYFIIDDSAVRSVVESALQEIYHFSGSFKIQVDDFPF